MSDWFLNAHNLLIIFFICIVIIFAQGIVIFKLSKNKDEKDYGKGKIAKKIKRFESFWGEFVMYVLATSVVGLFVASFVQDKNITLSDMNSWVSIVLGLVALVVGIISLWLSFYNVDQVNKSQEKIEKKVNELNGGTGWQEAGNNKWFYKDKDGDIVRNQWQKSGDSWFYLGKDGYIMLDSLIKGEKGALYYVDTDGRMVKDTTIMFDEGERCFGSNGKAIMIGEYEISGVLYKIQDGYIKEKK